MGTARRGRWLHRCQLRAALPLCRRDPRIRPFRLHTNRGPSAARNEGLRHARGQKVTYLDCNDEYYPDYLSWVHRCRTKAEVLVFAYDAVDEDGVFCHPEEYTHGTLHPCGQLYSVGTWHVRWAWRIGEHCWNRSGFSTRVYIIWRTGTCGGGLPWRAPSFYICRSRAAFTIFARGVCRIRGGCQRGYGTDGVRDVVMLTMCLFSKMQVKICWSSCIHGGSI